MFLPTIVVLMPSSWSRAVHLRLQDLADVDLGDADVAVRVALDVLQLREIARRRCRATTPSAMTATPSRRP